MTVATLPPIDAEIVGTADEWAEIIKADLSKATEGVIAASEHLLTAKAAVGHGDWLPMLRKIGISERYAEQFMSVGKNVALTNPRNCSDLPSSARTLYELSRAPAEAIESALASGKVTVTTTAKQAKEFVREAKGAPPPPPPPPPPSKEEQQRHNDAVFISGIMLSFQPSRMPGFSKWAKRELIKELKKAITNLEESLEK